MYAYKAQTSHFISIYFSQRLFQANFDCPTLQEIYRRKQLNIKVDRLGSKKFKNLQNNKRMLPKLNYLGLYKSCAVGLKYPVKIVFSKKFMM